jgi:hypothetical protein
MGDTCIALAAAVAVTDALTCGVECLPCDTRGIVDPGFLRLGVATCGFALLDHHAAGIAQPPVDLLKFVSTFDLDSEMIQTGLAPARRDRKIHTGIVEHPFGVVALENGRFGREQR